MSKLIYTQQQDRLTALSLNRLSLKDQKELNTYTFVKANLTHYMPMLSKERYWAIFRQFRLGQWLNGLDARYFEGQYPLAIEGWETCKEQIQSTTQIMATYHFGAFQLINYLLVRAHIPYALLVSGHVRADWQERYPGLMQELDRAAERNQFYLLDANDRASLRQMYGLVKQGFHILIYVDGLEGYSPTHATDTVAIPLLGQRVKVPTGAAKLSHALGISILPLLAIRHADRVEIVTFDPIRPNASVERAEYVKRASQHVFTLFTPYLTHWPEQWTNWPLAHSMLAGKELIRREKERTELPRESDFGLYQLADDYYLLRNEDYRSFPLDRITFDKLFDIWYPEA